MTEKLQINVRTSADRYEYWKGVVGDQPGDQFKTISDLVRKAVDDKVAEIEGDRVSGQADTPSGDRDLSGITEDLLPAIRNIESTVEDLDGRMRALEREQDAGSDTPDLNRVLPHLLPSTSEGEIDVAQDAATATELAKKTGAPEAQVRDALNDLVNARNSSIRERVRPEAGDDSEPVRAYWKE